MKKGNLYIMIITVLFGTVGSSIYSRERFNRRLPGGSYNKTCYQCKIEGLNTLTCLCAKRNGKIRKTSIELKPNIGLELNKTYSNIDGFLRED